MMAFTNDDDIWMPDTTAEVLSQNLCVVEPRSARFRATYGSHHDVQFFLRVFFNAFRSQRNNNMSENLVGKLEVNENF